MSRYTQVFERAAQIVRATRQHPGQDFPGMWSLRQEDWPLYMGVIIGQALIRASAEADLKADSTLDRFTVITAGIPVDLKGDPAIMAATRLDSAAEINRNRVDSAVDHGARLIAITTDFLERVAAEGPPSLRTDALTLTADLRLHLMDLRASDE